MTETIDGLAPRTIEIPSDADAVARVLEKASDEKLAVVPRGGGTMLDLGAPLQRADILLSTAKLARVLDHQAENLTVQTEAGITLGALNQALTQKGQMLPLDAPFPARATIGGILATNASGPLRVRYGSTRDLLIGVRVALTDGQIVKGGGQVVKNVAGYDLPKLFIGSLGTLGVIVEASFKLAPLPKHVATIVASFEKMEHAHAVAQQILKSPLLPTALEILNPVASNSLGLGSGYALAARFGGIQSANARQTRDVEQWARERGAISVQIMDANDALWTRLRDFPFEQENVVKIGVLPAQIGEFAAHAERIAHIHRVGLAWRAHAVGIVYAALEGESVHVGNAICDLRVSAENLSGHLIIQRAPRVLRERVDAWGSPRSDWGLMRKLRADFDPNGVLNPERFGNI